MNKEPKKPFKGYKVFNSDFTCRGMQYEVGKVYHQDGEIKCCENGLHFCENPFDCLDFYPLVNDKGELNKFAEVRGGGDFDSDSIKVAVSDLKIIKELKLSDFINAGVEFIQNEAKPYSNGDDAKIGSSGDRAKIGSSGCGAQIGSSGYGAQIGSSGDRAKIGSSGYGAQIGSSGDRAKIGSSGDGAKIGSSGDDAKIGSSGDDAKIGSSGDRAKIGSSGDDAKIGSSGDRAKIGSSGYGAQIGSSGDRAKIGSSGDGARVDSTGKYSVICCSGHGSIAKGKKGSWITLSEWEYSDKEKCDIPICVKTKKIDGKTIKEDTYYRLEHKKFMECDEDGNILS